MKIVISISDHTQLCSILTSSKFSDCIKLTLCYIHPLSPTVGHEMNLHDKPELLYSQVGSSTMQSVLPNIFNSTSLVSITNSLHYIFKAIDCFISVVWMIKATWVHVLKEARSLTAKWLDQASQWHEMYCHDLEVMSSVGSNLGCIVLLSYVILDPKI